jgi:hypothetical protein
VRDGERRDDAKRGRPTDLDDEKGEEKQQVIIAGRDVLDTESDKPVEPLTPSGLGRCPRCLEDVRGRVEHPPLDDVSGGVDELRVLPMTFRETGQKHRANHGVEGAPGREGVVHTKMNAVALVELAGRTPGRDPGISGSNVESATDERARLERHAREVRSGKGHASLELLGSEAKLELS